MFHGGVGGMEGGPPSVGAEDASAAVACAIDGAVLATVVSAAYGDALLGMAQSARLVGFPCVLVQPYQDFWQLRSPLVRALSLPPAPFLPRQQWCGSQRYGWRRAHFYRVRLWHVVFTMRLDLLAVDLDWNFADLRGQPLRLDRPMNALRAARTQEGYVPDVIALHDGPTKGLFNVGLMWLRASKAMLALVHKCYNRTTGAWEQGVFNEELNFGLLSLRCCHPDSRTACDLRTFVRPIERVHNLGHETALAEKRRKYEGQDECAPLVAAAAHPPNTSRYLWVATSSEGRPMQRAWRPYVYNELSRRPLARCTKMSNVCRCPALPDNDEHWRTLGGTRIINYLKTHKEQVNLTVRGSAFHLGLKDNATGPHSAYLFERDKSSMNESGILLRDWLKWTPPWFSKQRVQRKKRPRQHRAKVSVKV